MKVSSLFVLLGTVSLFMTLKSCYPEKLQEPEKASKLSQVQNRDVSDPITMAKLAEIDFNKIQMENGMLKFDSRATMLETISKLRQANHLWRQFYNQTMEGLDEETANQMSISESFPYEWFQEQTGYYSLWKSLEEQRNEWLAQSGEELDFSNYPDHHIKDNPVKSIVSVEGEVMVGNSIFKEYPYGLNVEIPDSDFNLLYQLREIAELPDVYAFATQNQLPLLGDWDNLGALMVEDICIRHQEKTCRWSPSDNKLRLRAEIGVWNSAFFAVRKVWAENDTYRKRLGIWWTHRTNQFAGLTGNIWKTDRGNLKYENCEQPYSLSWSNNCNNCSRLEAEYHEDLSLSDLYVSNKLQLVMIGTHKAFGLDKNTCLPEGNCSPSDCN
jgi:Leucine-rich repeat (LRR) protein